MISIENKSTNFHFQLILTFRGLKEKLFWINDEKLADAEMELDLATEVEDNQQLIKDDEQPNTTSFSKNQQDCDNESEGKYSILDELNISNLVLILI